MPQCTHFNSQNLPITATVHYCNNLFPLLSSEDRRVSSRQSLHHLLRGVCPQQLSKDFIFFLWLLSIFYFIFILFILFYYFILFIPSPLLPLPPPPFPLQLYSSSQLTLENLLQSRILKH